MDPDCLLRTIRETWCAGVEHWIGARRFPVDKLSARFRPKKRIAKYPLAIARAQQIGYALFKDIASDEICVECLAFYAVNHRDKYFSNEGVAQPAAVRIPIDGVCCHDHVAESCFGNQRMQTASDMRVAPGAALQFDLAANGSVGRGAVGMEECAAVIAFDGDEAAVRFQERLQLRQGTLRSGHVFENETRHDGIKGGDIERQRKQIGVQHTHVFQLPVRDAALRLVDGRSVSVEGDEVRSRISFGQYHRLRTDPAAGFEHDAAGREPCLSVQQIGELARLIDETLAFGSSVSVNVIGHAGSLRSAPSGVLNVIALPLAATRRA